jgi:hypothetical protein
MSATGTRLRHPPHWVVPSAYFTQRQRPTPTAAYVTHRLAPMSSIAQREFLYISRLFRRFGSGAAGGPPPARRRPQFDGDLMGPVRTP